MNLNYRWTLKDANFTKDKGKVFSCFACGGGSTMGYKLAGFDVIGCNEIDPKMIEAYKVNHNPKYAFLEPIQTFKMREDLPKELYELDILDGSPPCSNFSMAGNREKDWGKEKKFREGQSMQVLDTLFFDFIDLAKKLQPKVVIAENVKGLLLGDAISYVRQIYREFDLAGYYCQHWLLDASKMGVPQRRERVFFIALRKDLAKQFLKQINLFDILPELKLEFNEKNIQFKEYRTEKGSDTKLTERQQRLIDNKQIGDKSFSDISQRIDNGKISGFTDIIVSDDQICPTWTAGGKNFRYYDNMWFSKEDYCYAMSFPVDYDFMKNQPIYITGMSVPPLMIAKIAEQVYLQWLSKLNGCDSSQSA
jgi:DNA (cytosine-5)-methyltransferase 1